MEWPAQFEALIIARLADSQPLRADDDLAARGLDSLETIGLLSDIEDSFGIMISDELLSHDTFSTPTTLWAAVQSEMGDQS